MGCDKEIFSQFVSKQWMSPGIVFAGIKIRETKKGIQLHGTTTCRQYEWKSSATL